MPLDAPTAVERPTRTRGERIFSDEFVQAVVKLFNDGQTAVKYGEYEPGSHKAARGKNKGKDNTEIHARSEGMNLAREVKRVTGKMHGVSTWTDGNGKIVGALLAREAKQRKSEQK